MLSAPPSAVVRRLILKSPRSANFAMRLSAFLFVLLGLSVSGVGAQSVPLLSVDATREGGAHTTQTAHVYYFDDAASFLHVAMTVRLGTAGAIRPILVLEANSDCAFLMACGDYLVCALAPNNTCRQHFSNPMGLAAGLGVAGSWRSILLGEVTAGGARGASQVRYIGADVSLRLIPHLAAIVGARHVVWKDRLGDRNWFFPTSVGLRVF